MCLPKQREYHTKKLKHRKNMRHFKAFGMINLQCEIRTWYKFLMKPQMTKTSQDNNLNMNIILKNTDT
jgi:hypothetical protein